MDDETLAAAAADDPAAFAELYRRHVRLVTGFAARRVDDADELADVVSTVWLRVLEGIGRFDPDRGRFVSWLLGVTSHVASEERRRSTRRRRLSLRVAGQRVLEDDERAALEDALAARQLAPAVRSAMEQLSPTERTALDLLAADVSYEEAAVLLKVTPAALRMRVHRARRRLDDLLLQHHVPAQPAHEGDPR